jgi:glucose-6-phosphate 1-dehydrogenase
MFMAGAGSSGTPKSNKISQDDVFAEHWYWTAFVARQSLIAARIIGRDRSAGWAPVSRDPLGEARASLWRRPPITESCYDSSRDDMNGNETALTGNIAALALDSERQPLPLLYIEEPVTITIFGASGDLTLRKLVPALYALFCQGLFHERFAIVGYARRDYGDAGFRERMREAVKTFSRLPVDAAQLDPFIGRVFYHQGDLDDPEAFRSLKIRYQDEASFPANQVFYLATTPEHFLPTIENLRKSELICAPHCKSWSRVVIEKPFGRDLESARKLNQDVLRHLDETQIYRIDHYLGKETVQNILGFRLANSIFEPVFNRHHVDHIQITASETVGMESGRGAYYDSAGALRDMVQNHLLQLLCLVAMEPPSNLTADALRNAKVQLLDSLLPPAPHEIGARTIRGQYVAGEVNGQPVPAYVHEERVAPGSRTETYCALRLSIENWRWAGVPVYLRTGKRLKKRLTEILVQFKQPPLQMFRTVECVGDVCDLTLSRPNALMFRIQPDEGIALRFSAKRPAMQFVVESVAMNFSYRQTWDRALPEAYERLLLDAMRGDSTLFTRSDQVEAAWQVMDPIMKAWESRTDLPIHDYVPGSWGPEAAGDLLGREGRTWKNSE